MSLDVPFKAHRHDDAKALWDSGNKIAAIKLIRAHNSNSLDIFASKLYCERHFGIPSLIAINTLPADEDTLVRRILVVLGTTEDVELRKRAIARVTSIYS